MRDITSVNATKVVMKRFKKFESKVTKDNADGILLLLTENAWWRDLLVKTLHV